MSELLIAGVIGFLMGMTVIYAAARMRLLRRPESAPPEEKEEAIRVEVRSRNLHEHVHRNEAEEEARRRRYIQERMRRAGGNPSGSER